MTEFPRRTRSGVINNVAWASLLVAGALLQGCSNSGGQQGPAVTSSRLPIYAADLAGAAKHCDVPDVQPVAGKALDVPIKLGNDGGWCGIPVHQDGPKPYDAGLLMRRPSHGTVVIHQVGDDTRIDYTPDAGFQGVDHFSVQLIPGDAVLNVAANVTAGGGS